MYDPPSNDYASDVGDILANHVLIAVACPMAYITNGNTLSIDAGESVTLEAHVVTGTPTYTDMGVYEYRP